MILPQTSPVRDPILIFMSPTSTLEDSPPTPTASKLPEPYNGTNTDGSFDVEVSPTNLVPSVYEPFRQPKLRFEIRDLHHAGSQKFLSAVNAATVLETAVANVQRLLYRSPSDKTTKVPPTRSVTVVLRDMGGVAYTTGSDLDDDHKEIHFSLPYINGIQPPSRATHEITGVLTHELVHCYQWNAKGTCPGGLIEGVADWVRLNCSLSPPHWKRNFDGAWDRGYEHTAYFLEYLEQRFGEGTVRRLNEKLRLEKYQEKPFWTELVGRPVDQLWQDYRKDLGKARSASGQDERAQNGETIDEGTRT
jgi:hypothetical protein